MERKLKGVYVIGEPRREEDLSHFFHRVEEVLRAGVKIFQLRIKEPIGDAEYLKIAKSIRQLTHQWQSLFILNDRPDLVLLSQADGLHLGPTDLPVEEARKIIGRKILGLSNHTYQQIVDNAHRDVDYFSIGPIYPTTSKKIPDPVVGVEMIEKGLPLLSHRPVVAIGGITLERLREVLKTEVAMVGVIRDIMEDQDPYQKALKFCEAFANFKISGKKIGR